MKHFNGFRVKKVEYSDGDYGQPQEAAILSLRDRLAVTSLAIQLKECQFLLTYGDYFEQG